MKLKNKLVKQFAVNNTLRSKNQMYSNYVEADSKKVRYVMVDETDIVVCNEDHKKSYEQAGFAIFGFANSEEELKDLINKAEVS